MSKIKKRWIHEEMADDAELAAESQARQTADLSHQQQIDRLFFLRTQVWEATADQTLSTSSESTWVTYLELLTPSLELGDYRLFCVWEGDVASNGRSMEVRLTVNGTVIYTRIRYGTNLKESLASARFYKLAQTSGITSIKLEFRVGPDGSTTVQLDTAKLLLWREGY